MKKSLFIALFISLGLFLVLSTVLIQLISYLHPIVLAVVFFCLFLLVFFLILLIRKETIRLPYPLFLGLLIMYSICLIILLFIRPTNQSYHSINLFPFSTISFYLSGKVNLLISFYNLAANIGLFVPYGIYFMIKNLSPLKRIFLPLTSIALIEILQFTTHRGNLDIDDLILNMVGVFLGYFLFPIFKRIVNLDH